RRGRAGRRSSPRAARRHRGRTRPGCRPSGSTGSEKRTWGYGTPVRTRPDFWWGTGASSTQAEGAAPASDWYAMERAGRVPPSGDGNGFASRYAEDFALYAQYGLPHHRLSIEWARLEPEEGKRDDAAIEHYVSVLTAARD